MVEDVVGFLRLLVYFYDYISIYSRGELVAQPELKAAIEDYRVGVQIHYDVGKLAESGRIAKMDDHERAVVLKNLTQGVLAMTRGMDATTRWLERNNPGN
jgi:hypothetical protein